MAEKVLQAGVVKEAGYLYFIDKQGHISRSPLKKPGVEHTSEPEVVFKAGIVRDKGFLYFLDKDGDIGRSAAKRGGTKKAGDAPATKKKAGTKKA